MISFQWKIMVIIEKTKSSSDISLEETKEDEQSLNTVSSPRLGQLCELLIEQKFTYEKFLTGVE